MASSRLHEPSSPLSPDTTTQYSKMRKPSTANQFDEGYSEETRSQPDSDMVYVGDEAASVEDARMENIVQEALTYPAHKRMEMINKLLRSLPHADKDHIAKHIHTLTHFDPVNFLPVEMWMHVLGYLSPEDLLATSSVTREWRARTAEEAVWRKCFAREGWVLDDQRVKTFERQSEKIGRVAAEATLTGKSRKRSRGEAFSEAEHGRGGGVAGTTLEEATVTQEVERMEGVEETTSSAIEEDDIQTTSEHPGQHLIRTAAPHDGDIRPTNNADHDSTRLRFRPPVFRSSSTRELKVSWPYLYKQRRRLEANWDAGDHKKFTLPHREHLDEGHKECVYAIQHSARHLVSSSRDKSIRIWDLQTQRLKLAPLLGHEASVLCLQFDERPEQDIIVSGGSDSAVIIWKFSTGEMVKHIRDAHDMPVLNLRFDDRYIVTCSKDRTIKVWNRHALARNSPLIPTAVIEEFANPKYSLHGGNGPQIEPFTLLNTIRGHGAAVNAVMIHENTIVSASGDRTVRAWDIMTGATIKSYTGHTKGIACVQFDGRRVVSGSSDNTVRIFDADIGAEVATLVGHTNLVRTVQARFGDLATTTDEELARQAARADAKFHRAVAEGMDPAQTRRSQMRAAGSDHPEDRISVGAKIPPGGGGTRWAKIVSGSYDESVIVWRRDPKARNNWTPKLKLHLNADDSDRATRHLGNQNIAAQQQPGTAAQAQIPPPPPPAHAQAAVQTGPAQQQVGPVQHAHANVHSNQHHAHNAMPQAAQHIQQQIQQHVQQHVQQQAQQAQQAQPAQPVQPVQQQAAPPAQQQNGVQPPPLNARESNRIFKLQFDARRIICCSQNKTIVGWDFANGDPELERIGDWSNETA